jgi:ferredoxin-NADP reductase
MTGDAPAQATITVRLSAIEYAARDTNLYTFTPIAGGALPDAEAGAHIGLMLPGGLERQYSLVHAGPVPMRYVVGVKRDAASRGGSQYLHDTMKVGDRLEIAPPRNNFPLNSDAEHTVLIAGGIGVTPIYCMVQQLERRGASFELHYACRAREDAAFIDQLAGRSNVHLHFDDENGGAVMDIASAVRAASPEAHLYCCGPTPMLAAFEAACAGRPAEQVHVEYFTQKYEAAEDGGYTVVLARSQKEFLIPPGKSILHVLQDAGIDVASSCEEGVCGACETAVLSGTPDHRDAILSDQERAANDTMFICCSGSKSERLVLDR